MKENFITRLFKPKAEVQHDLHVTDLGTMQPLLRTLRHYQNDNYENGYSSIRAIANRFFVIKPHAIDDNGKPYEKAPNVLNVLARPNKEMSGVDFRDALAVMTLVHSKVHVLVWEKHGRDVRPATENLREDRIAGFTFLEDVVESVWEGKIRYQVNWGNEPRYFYEHQVMTFYDINPNHLSGGYSPSKAARRWTRIDDYIADYQTGFFENGAIPSGQFIITAPTAQEYKDIKKNMERKHRGAGKNNNVLYTYQPIDPVTNKPGQATITWVPFNVTNKDMSLQEIFDQSNKKIDSVYGVSAFIRAIDEAPNFATAQVIERNFVENTVRPFAIKKWSRFQHELNRITGGLGYGITFELETPHIAEEEESIARTNSITASTIMLLENMGYSLDSIADAMDLSPRWKLLKKGSTPAKIENEKTDVDEGGEVEGAPGDPQAKIKRPKALTLDELQSYEKELEKPARALMESQIERAVQSLDVVDIGTDSEREEFVNAMMAIVSGTLLSEGVKQFEEGKLMALAAGLPAVTGTFTLSDDAIARYREYLNTVFDSYSTDTQTAIRNTLERSYTEQLSRQETEAMLRNIVVTDEWRITRIGVSESNRSLSIGSIEGMMALEDELEGGRIEK